MTATRREPPPKVTCPYCGNPAALLLDSSGLYASGRNYGPMWACRPCGAWVGCHKNSKRHTPMGRLADAPLRAAKVKAHAAFDRLWRAKAQRDEIGQPEARRLGYAWLAGQMGLEKSACHIGHFDLEQCRRVAELCAPYARSAR